MQEQLAGKSIAQNTVSLSSQKLRLIKAQADKAEFEVQIIAGKYIAIDAVEMHWSNLLIAFRSKMLDIKLNIKQV